MQESAAFTLPQDPSHSNSGAAGRGWGPAGAALGWTAAILLGYTLLQIAVAAAVLAAAGGLGGDAPTAAGLAAALEPHFGLVLWLWLAVACPLGIAALAALARRRSAGRARQALGLVLPDGRRALLWLAATAAVVTAFEVAARLLDRPPMTEFLADAVVTAGSVAALAVAVVVLAPAFEELLFRGFLLPGLARSPLGGAGAVTVSAASWAAIHLQYDRFDLAAIFALGLVFGEARRRTGSTVLVFGLHAAVNLAAMAEALWWMGRAG
jgi:hypothetical protein